MNNFYHLTAKIAKEKYLKFKNRLEKSISSGRFETFSRKKKNQWISRVEKYRLRLEKYPLASRGAVAAGSVLTAAAAMGQTPDYLEEGSTILLTVPSGNVAIANLDDDADFEILFSTSGGGYVTEKDGTYTNPSGLSGLTDSFVVGDLDGDGVDDVIYYQPGGSPNILGSFNDGYGLFGTPTTLGYRGFASSNFRILDFDSDGDNDIVWLDNVSGYSYIVALENNGGGSFASDRFVYSPSVNIKKFEFNDFDGDGDQDLIAITDYASYEYVTRWINTVDGLGDPNFTNRTDVFQSSQFHSINGMVIADFDDDGNDDILFNRSFESSFNIQLLNGDHPTQNTIGFTAGDDLNVSNAFVTEMEPIDIDGDGDLDVLLSFNGFLPSVAINDDQTFNDSFYLGIGSGYGEFSYVAYGFAVGDLDDDGLDDVVTASAGALNYGYINVYTVPVPASVSHFTNEFSERVANNDLPVATLLVFDADGDRINADLSFATGDGSNDADNALFTISDGKLLAASDLDFSVQNTFNIYVEASTSEGSAASALTLRMEDSPEAGRGTFEKTGDNLNFRVDAGVIEDIDGDGDMDFVYHRFGSIYYNDDVAAGGEYIAYASYINLPSSGGEFGVDVYDYRDFLVVDIDNDGDKDLIVADYSSVRFYDFEGGAFSYDGGVGISGASGPSLYQGVTDIAVADVDGDGDVDVFAVRDGYISVLKKGGEGGFYLEDFIYTRYGINNIAVGDIDGDADADIVYGFGNLGIYSIYGSGAYMGALLNNNGGEWGAESIYTSAGAVDIVLEDFDNDGDLDILSIGVNGYSKYRGGLFLDNDGDGNFSSRGGLFGLVGGPIDEHATGVMDIDGDGDLDVLRATGFFRSNGIARDVNEGGEIALDIYNKYYLFNASLDELYGSGGEISTYDKYSSFAFDRVETIIPGDIDNDGRVEALISWRNEGNTYTYLFENQNIAPRIQEGFLFPGLQSIVQTENNTEDAVFGRFYALDPNQDEISVSLADGDNDNNLFSVSTISGGEFGGEYSIGVEVTANGDIDFDDNEDMFVQIELSDGSKSRIIDFNPSLLNVPENGYGTISEDPTILTSTYVKNAIFGDADVDGDTDIILGGEGTSEVVIEVDGKASEETQYTNNFLEQVEDGDFVLSPVTSYEYGFTNGVFYDLDGDGDQDLIASTKYEGGEEAPCCVIEADNRNSPTDRVFLIRNNDGSFDGSKYFDSVGSIGSGIEQIALGDFDGDGIADIAILHSNGDLRVRGGETNSKYGGFDFSNSEANIYGYDFDHIAVGDVDGDGLDDILAVSDNYSDYLFAGNEYLYSMGAGTSVFGGGEETTGAQHIELGDLDGDGSLDAIVTSSNLGFDVFLNDGSGGFTSESRYVNSEDGFGDYLYSIKLADLDGDGDVDIATLGIRYGGEEDQILLTTYLNDGNATFSQGQNFEASEVELGSEDRHKAMNLVDIDNDDDTDIVITNGGEGTGIVAFTNDNAPPTGISLDETSFDENLEVATQVATVSVQDPNANDSFTISLSAGDGTNDADNSKFEVDGDKLLILESPDFESQSEYRINIEAVDAGSNSITAAFTLTVNDIEPEANGLEDDQMLTLYPNPGRDLMVLQMDHAVTGDVIIRVSDISGRVIHEMTDVKRYDSWSRNVPMASQEPGVYIVELTIGDNIYKQRWIKQ